MPIREYRIIYLERGYLIPDEWRIVDDSAFTDIISAAEKGMIWDVEYR